MNIALILPGYLSGVIALAGLAFTIWAAHNRSEVDDLDRAERKAKEAESELKEARRELIECKRERDRLQQQVYDLLDRLYRGEGGKRQ